MSSWVITRRKATLAKPAGPGGGEIVCLDQAPLRRSVASDCTTVMARLERLRLDWHHFERKDKPAFVRWRAREFGALLSKAREVEDRLRDLQALIHEVETEMRRHFQDVHTAYQRVVFRRENPAAVLEDDPDEAEPSAAGAARKLTEFEKEALFQEWVQKVLGTNPDKMDDRAYSTTFEVFKSHMFFGPREEPHKANARRRTEKARTAAEQEFATASPSDGGHEQVDLRVKELYRKLVRRLHPDLRADGNTAVSAIWHEVQEAYTASDVARMEILLALSEMEVDQLGEGTSLFQMRAVLAELDRSFRALEKSLREAEGEDAWDFARTGPSEDLRVRMERQLKHDLAGRMERLDLLTQTIASWARGPALSSRARLIRRPGQARA